MAAPAFRFSLASSGGRPGSGSWRRDVLGRGAAWRQQRRQQRRGARRGRGRVGGAAGGGDRAGARGEPEATPAAAAGGARAGERGGAARPGRFPEPHPATEGSRRAGGACALLRVGRWSLRRSGKLPRGAVRLRALGRAAGSCVRGGECPRIPCLAGSARPFPCCWAEEAQAGTQGSVGSTLHNGHLSKSLKCKHFFSTSSPYPGAVF